MHFSLLLWTEFTVLCVFNLKKGEMDDHHSLQDQEGTHKSLRVVVTIIQIPFVSGGRKL